MGYTTSWQAKQPVQEIYLVSAMRAKRIALTGVSRGLGLPLAAGFIEAGHTVYG